MVEAGATPSAGRATIVLPHLRGSAQLETQASAGRATIVLPHWVLELPAGQRQAVIAHEILTGWAASTTIAGASRLRASLRLGALGISDKPIPEQCDDRLSIAKNAGVAEGTFFRYFPTKDDLLNQLYLELKSDLVCHLTVDLKPDADIRVQFHHLWIRYIDWEYPVRRSTKHCVGAVSLTRTRLHTMQFGL